MTSDQRDSDGSDDSDAVAGGLADLAARARALADALTHAADQLAIFEPIDARAPLGLALRHADSFLVAHLVRYLRARRRRETLFPDGLFADPAWDMLLELFVAEKKGVAISVSSACIASAVPPTTALRWIGRLEQLGMIVRHADAEDSRRTWLRLSRETSDTIANWTRESFSNGSGLG